MKNIRNLVTTILVASLALVACKKEYDTPSTASAGTFGSATDTCTGAVISGSFKSNTALTGANTVTLTVNVTKPGTYTIASDTLKGISFKGTGSFTTTGVQSVTISAAGIPIDSAAALRIPVKYGASVCTLLIKIDLEPITVIPPSGDYFPTTANSNWSYSNYNQTGTILDTAYVFSTGTFKTILSNPYSIFLQKNGTRTDSLFYRKSGGIYYQGSAGTSLTNGVALATKILNDGVAAGSTWSDTFTIVIGGQNRLLKYDYTILAKAVPATVNSFGWTDVIKVKSVVNTNFTGVFIPDQTFETWYARGAGIIYQKITDNRSISNASTEYRLRRYTIAP
jgi:hypothetical protein